MARQRLEEHRRSREKQRGAWVAFCYCLSGFPRLTFFFFFPFCVRATEGITATQDRKSDAPKGLGDFQRRSNRDNRRWGRDQAQRDGRGWDTTPRSERGGRDRARDAPSIRVPNVGWESTPRRGGGADGSDWGGARNRAWDAPTPRVPRGASPEDDGLLGVDMREWEEEQLKLDRDWYSGAEEGFVAGDEERNPLAQYEDLNPLKAEVPVKPIVSIPVAFLRFEVLIDLVAEADISPTGSIRSSFFFSSSLVILDSVLTLVQNADNDLWEANRMLTSGIATRKEVDLNFEDESESAVHVMVHELKPPFLDGKTIFTKQLEPINPIRDPSSDMAVFSKKGSALVKEKREQAERAKAAAKLASLEGTSLGNIMGVEDTEAAAEGAYYSSPAAVFVELDIHVAILDTQLQHKRPRRPG